MWLKYAGRNALSSDFLVKRFIDVLKYALRRSYLPELRHGFLSSVIDLELD